MILFIYFILQLIPADRQPYIIHQENISFSYAAPEAREVYVAGNLNNWARSGDLWKMRYDSKSKLWSLTVPISEIKKGTSNFYEFTFRVDDKLVDADSGSSSSIYCHGYGYRYVIKGI